MGSVSASFHGSRPSNVTWASRSPVWLRPKLSTGALVASAHSVSAKLAHEAASGVHQQSGAAVPLARFALSASKNRGSPNRATADKDRSRPSLSAPVTLSGGEPTTYCRKTEFDPTSSQSPTRAALKHVLGGLIH